MSSLFKISGYDPNLLTVIKNYLPVRRFKYWAKQGRGVSTLKWCGKQKVIGKAIDYLSMRDFEKPRGRLLKNRWKYGFLPTRHTLSISPDLKLITHRSLLEKKKPKNMTPHRIQVVNAHNFRRVTTWPSFKNTTCAKFNPDGKKFLTVSYNMSSYRSVKTGKSIWKQRQLIGIASFDGTGKYYAGGTELRGDICLFDVRTSPEYYIRLNGIAGFGGYIHEICWSNDNYKIFCARETSVGIFDIRNSKQAAFKYKSEKKSLAHRVARTRPLDVSIRNDKILLLVGSNVFESVGFSIYDLNDHIKDENIPIPFFNCSPYSCCIEWNDDTSQFALGNVGGEVEIWDNPLRRRQILF